MIGIAKKDGQHNLYKRLAEALPVCVVHKMDSCVLFDVDTGVGIIVHSPVSIVAG